MGNKDKTEVSACCGLKPICRDASQGICICNTHTPICPCNKPFISSTPKEERKITNTKTMQIDGPPVPNPIPWEEEFDNQFAYVGRKYFKYDEVKGFIGRTLHSQLEEQKNIPMGVSQWMNYGAKFGYDEFFREKILEEIIQIWGNSYFSSVHSETEHFIKIKPKDFQKLDFFINKLKK